MKACANSDLQTVNAPDTPKSRICVKLRNDVKPPTFYALPNLNLGQVTNLSKPLKVHEVLDRSSSEEVEPKGWTLQSLFEASEKHCPRKVKCPETQAHRWLVS